MENRILCIVENRILCIGDIHGCANTLKSLINKINLTQEDTLVFLGDYVDRGDKVFEVVDFLVELDKKYTCIFIKGNHDHMWINYLKNKSRMEEINTFFFNGGQSTLDSYCMKVFGEKKHNILWDEIPESHQRFFENLKTIETLEEFVFVHAGINPDFPLEEQQEHDLLWIRGNFLYYPEIILKGKTIVHGHTPMDTYELIKYNLHEDRMNLDSGCVFGLNLTCVDVRNGTRYTQEMIDRRVA